jgi:hypothetical protein
MNPSTMLNVLFRRWRSEAASATNLQKTTSALRRLRRTGTACALLITAAVAPSLSAGVLPLQESRWDNPAFVAAFTASYGVDTERNPNISAEEKKFFETLAPVIAANPAEAATTLAAAITPQSSAALDYTLANIYFQTGKIPEAATA